jgi:hypothetical protein
MQPSRAQLLYTYALAKARLKRAKEAEAKWRVIIATTLFDDVVIGTNWTPEHDVKLVTKLNISLVKDADIVAVMTAACAKFPEVNFNPIFKTELKFVESEYHLLPDEAKLAVAPLLIIKPGLPTITLANETE